MGKKNKQAGTEGAPTAPRSRAAHRRPTFNERLIIAADGIFAKATMVAEMCAKKGVPREATQVAQDFIPVAEKYREVFFNLKNSGWEPPAKAALVTIAEGDKIAIRPEVRTKLYDYIPDSVQLVAGTITKTGKMVKVVLLSEEDYHPYGRAARSHLMLR